MRRSFFFPLLWQCFACALLIVVIFTHGSAQDYTPVRLTNDGAESTRPRLAMDDNYLYVVWQDTRSGSRQIWWAKHTWTGALTAGPVQLSSSGSPNEPSVGVDAAGNSYVIWLSGSAYSSGVVGTKVDPDGNTLVAPKSVSIGQVGNPELDVASDGTCIVTCDRRSTADHNMHIYRLDSNLDQVCHHSRPGNAVVISDRPSAVAIDEAGVAHVIFRDTYFFAYYIQRYLANPSCGSNGDSKIINNDYTNPAIGWSGTQEWITVETGTNIYCYPGMARVNDVAGGASQGRVGDDPDNGMAVWHDSRDGNWEIYFSVFNGATPFSDVNLTNDLSSQQWPDIATHPGHPGEFWAVWQDNRDGNNEIYLTSSYVPIKGSILVYVTSDDTGYPSTDFDDDLASILTGYNYSVTVTDRAGTPAIDQTLLAGYDQFWLISTEFSIGTVLTQSEIDAVLAFREQGHGLFIASDHEPFYSDDANAISQPLGVTFSGEWNFGNTGISPVFVPHPVTAEVTTIFGHESEAGIGVVSPAEVIAQYSGVDMIAVRDDGLGRVAFDGSFVRCLDGYASQYDNPQYLQNVADWLMTTTDVGLVSGSVMADGTGSPLAGVQIRALQAEVEIAASITGDDGTYMLPALPVGTYSIEASKENFSTQVAPNILVQKGQTTIVDFVLGNDVIVGNIKIYADNFEELRANTYRAWGNVGFSGPFYSGPSISFGVNSEITYDLLSGEITVVLLDASSMIGAGYTYPVSNLINLSIDSEAGTVAFHGELGTAVGAGSDEKVVADFNLDLSERSLGANDMAFVNPIFVALAPHDAVIALGECTFLGFNGEADLSSAIEFADGFALNPTAGVNTRVTVGLFLNSGVFRVGYTLDASLSFDSGDKVDFNVPTGLPISGIIEYDPLSLTVRVIEDVNISVLGLIPKDADSAANPGAGLTLDVSRAESLPDITEMSQADSERALGLDLGINLLGQEHFDDNNCNGIYEPEIDEFFPHNPEYDQDLDGAWDEGTMISFWNAAEARPQLHISTQATAEVQVFWVPIKIAEANFSCNLPDDRIFHLDGAVGAQLGTLFDVEFADGSLDFDFDQRHYAGTWSLGHRVLTPLVVNGEFLLVMDPLDFNMVIDNAVTLGFIDLATAGVAFHIDEQAVWFSSQVTIVGLLTSEATLLVNPQYLEASAEGPLLLGSLPLRARINARIGGDMCLRGSAQIGKCFGPVCIGPTVTFYACSAIDWGVGFGGLWISIGCPANLHVYDSQGRHVGINDLGGVDLEIPGAEFTSIDDTALQYIYIPGADSIDGVRVEIEGIDDGEFEMQVLSGNNAGDSLVEVIYLAKPVANGSKARLDLASSDWSMEIDIEGDGVFESTETPDSVYAAPLWLPDFTIGDVTLDSVTSNVATVSWTTSLLSTGRLLLGQTEALDEYAVSDTILDTSHTVSVTGLLPETRYYYQIVSEDTTGFQIGSNLGTFVTTTTSSCCTLRGDADGTGTLNVADLTFIANYLFKDGPAPTCLDEADTDGSGSINIADITYFVAYLFKGGPAPVACP